MLKRLKEIIAYKEMIKSFVKKDLNTRYKGSFLGFLWTFVNPLLQLVVYSIIFPQIMKFSQDNYSMFLFVALIPWSYFTSCLQGSANIIIGNSNLVTKIYFPREVIPISFTISGLINMFYSYLIVFPMLILFKIPITWNILWLPFLFIFQMIMCLGFSMLISSLNVYFRDVEHIIGILVLAIYFMTPVIYDINMMPESFGTILKLNPMTGFITAYREVLYYGNGLDIQQISYSLIMSFVIFGLGYTVFSRLQKGFAEIL